MFLMIFFSILRTALVFIWQFDALTRLYVKTFNKIFARHPLATRRHHSGETLSEFLQELRKLSKNCNIKPVSAEQYREELIDHSFINEITSLLIHQCLLENEYLNLQTAFDQANALDMAQMNSEVYVSQVATQLQQ